MNKNRKKGFTLVELLVVIAILAILAVVSVVGYTSFTKKGKIASDLSLTTQMNNILQAEEAGGRTFETPSDAITALVDGGLDVRKLTPTTEGYIYVYNSLGKQGEKMVLLDENYEVKAPEGVELDSNKISYFTFVSEQSEIDKYSTLGYSVYLKDGYSSDTAYVSTSVDVGTNDSVTTINYTNTTAQTALIRTNNTRTTVNIYGPNDVVKHYGDAKEINIAEVAMSSYHENGSILGNINVAKGNVEIETKATVANVIITPVAKPKTSASDKTEKVKVEPAADSIKVEVKENAKVSTVQSTSSSVTVDEKVVSGTGATNVAKVDTTDSNVVYIGSKGYTNFNDALKAARDAKEVTIVLTKDTTLTDFNESASVYNTKAELENLSGTHLNKGNNITIDLNGKTLTYSKANGQNNTSAIYVTKGSSLTIKNGTFNANEMTNGTASLFNVKTNSSIYVYGVQLNTNGAALYPQGDAAKVVVDSSTINAGSYAVATNAATVNNYHVDISITNSQLSTQGFTKLTDSDKYDGDGATVLINVAGTLNIEDSKISGHRQALVVRAGTSTVKNTTISADLSYYHNTATTKEKEASTDGNDGCDINWGTGNNLPTYPVVIGSDSTSYKANAVCTFTNVTVENKTSIVGRTNRYIYLANNASYTTTFTYDSSSTGMNYNIRKDSKVTINGKEETGK